MIRKIIGIWVILSLVLLVGVIAVDMGVYNGNVDILTSTGDVFFIKGNNNPLYFENFTSITVSTNIEPKYSGTFTLGSTNAWRSITSEEYIFYPNLAYITIVGEPDLNEYDSILQTTLNTKLTKVRYNTENKDTIILLPEDAPQLILNGDRISLIRYIAMLHAAIKAQQREIEQLRAILERNGLMNTTASNQTGVVINSKGGDIVFVVG